jgi:hypothetical protein
MEPLTAGILAGGAIGGSLLGGFMGQQGQGDFARKQAREAAQGSRYQAQIASELMMPYQGAGQMAAQKLWGVSPVAGQATGPGAAGAAPTGGMTTTVPYLAGSKDHISNLTIGRQLYGQTGDPYDRTGGAGKYMGDLESLIKDFKFDTNDPAYRYKTEESGKSINKALAARGLYDSRAGVNMLTESDRAITADEYDKQYNRKYGGLSDLFGMSSKMGETGYQSLLDAVKVGTGASSAAGQMGNQAMGNLQSSYGQLAQQGNISDANKAEFWSGLGAMPMNAMLLYNMLGGQKQGTPNYADPYGH